MKRCISFGSVAVLAVLILAGGMVPAAAQPALNRVEIDLPAFNYDIIELTAFLGPDGKLRDQIPNFSGELIADPAGASGTVYLRAEAYVQLRGGSRSLLIDATTHPFELNGRLTITASDLREGGRGTVRVQTSTEGQGKEDLEKAASSSGFSTAPVGVYELIIEAYEAPAPGRLLGRTARRINVRNSSAGEVQVTLIDPQQGASVPTILPTFSWTSPNQNVTLAVYEMLDIHRAPEDAITGNPHLRLDLTGLSTFTYPASASRRIEMNKRYAWYVETEVVSNIRTERRRSEIRMFRTLVDNPVGRAVEQLMSNLGGGAAGTYSTLQSMNWVPNRVTLNGRPLTMEELMQLITTVTEQDIVDLRVE